MKLITIATLLALSSIAYGGLKEGKYLFLKPSTGKSPIQKHDALVYVREVEVIKIEGKKYLVIKFKGDPRHKMEASQIRAEILENEEKKSFYAVAPPHKFKVGDKVIERKRPEVFIGDIYDRGVIHCSWSSDSGGQLPSFTQYRMYPLNSLKK